MRRRPCRGTGSGSPLLSACPAVAIFALAAFALAVCGLVVAARPAAAKSVVADIDRHLIAITTDFSGQDVLIFGAVDQPGDVIMAMWGPQGNVQVHHKERVAGIWVNREAVDFGNVPAFYGIASSRPLYELLSPDMLDRYQLGVGRLRFKMLEADVSNVADYRTALIRARQHGNLYADRVGRVTFVGDTLFRANLRLPSTVPTGKFLIEVYLARDGQIVDAQTIPLVISKVGFGADIYRFANNNGFAYGVVAVIVALLAGWLAHLMFRRR